MPRHVHTNVHNLSTKPHIVGGGEPCYVCGFGIRDICHDETFSSAKDCWCNELVLIHQYSSPIQRTFEFIWAKL